MTSCRFARNAPPRSIVPPPGRSTDQIRPPTRSRASRTTTVFPAFVSSHAAVRPAYPAPTMQTSASTRSATPSTYPARRKRFTNARSPLRPSRTRPSIDEPAAVVRDDRAGVGPEALIDGRRRETELQPRPLVVDGRERRDRRGPNAACGSSTDAASRTCRTSRRAPRTASTAVRRRTARSRSCRCRRVHLPPSCTTDADAVDHRRPAPQFHCVRYGHLPRPKSSAPHMRS